MRDRNFYPRLEQLEDRYTPSCVSDFVVPVAPLGDNVAPMAESGLPTSGPFFGQSVSQSWAIGFGDTVPLVAKTC